MSETGLMEVLPGNGRNVPEIFAILNFFSLSFQKWLMRIHQKRVYSKSPGGKRIRGNKDQIIHKENGYLAAYKDSNDLAEGIIYCAENTAKLGEAAHRSAQKYSYEKIGQKYKEFCEEMLERKNTD